MNKKLLAATSPLGTGLRYSVIILSLLVLLELVFFSLVGGFDGRQVSGTPPSFELLYPVELGPQNNYDELVQRALFSPDRKPKDPVAQYNSQIKGKASENWLLVGVIKNGEQDYAIFSEIKDQRRLKLEPGMFLDEWKVESIGADQVALTKNGKSETLFLLVREPGKKSKGVVRNQSGLSRSVRNGAAFKKRTPPNINTVPDLAQPTGQMQAEPLQ